MGSEDQLRCLEIHIAVFDVLKSLLNAFICLLCLKILILFSSYWFYFFPTPIHLPYTSTPIVVFNYIAFSQPLKP